jgi:hypothetical protein
VSTVSGDSNTLIVVTPPMPEGFVDVGVNCVTGMTSAPQQFQFVAPATNAPAVPTASGAMLLVLAAALAAIAVVVMRRT